MSFFLFPFSHTHLCSVLGSFLLMKCDIVASLQVDEWWEQPASTVVEWVTVDGQNVAAWCNDVKQLKAFHDQKLR